MLISYTRLKPPPCPYHHATLVSFISLGWAFSGSSQVHLTTESTQYSPLGSTLANGPFVQEGEKKPDAGESGSISPLSLEWWLEIIGSGTGSNPKWQSLGSEAFASSLTIPPSCKTKPKFKQWSHKVICLRGWKPCDIFFFFFLNFELGILLGVAKERVPSYTFLLIIKDAAILLCHFLLLFCIPLPMENSVLY